jgi:hypothetical protein
MFKQPTGIMMVKIFDRSPGIKESLDILPVLGMGDIQDRHQVSLTSFHSTHQTDIPLDARDQGRIPGMSQT